MIHEANPDGFSQTIHAGNSPAILRELSRAITGENLPRIARDMLIP